MRNLESATVRRIALAAMAGVLIFGQIDIVAAEQSLKLVEFTPWLTKRLGPESAKGVVYFTRGWGGVTTGGASLDDFRLVPYLVKTLSDNGWDVIGAKFPNTPTKQHSAEFIPPAARFVEGRVRELKAHGYKRVVLAGHSWGAWVAMAAGKAGNGVDAVMAMAPNTYGPKVVPGGKTNPRFQRNISEFQALTNAMKTPTVLMLFAEDEFEGGDRGGVAKEQFAKNRIATLIIDKPAAFKGHFAGWLPIFDFAYGGCIRSFLENPKQEECRLPPLANDDVRSIVSVAQLANAGEKRITSGSPLVGKQFTAYPLGHFMQHFDYVSPNKRHTMVSLTEFDESVEFRGGLLCVKQTCSSLVRWSEREILEFDPEKGNLRAWWFEQ